MKALIVLALLLTLPGANAQFLPDARAVRSVSGEFVAYPSRPGYVSRFHKGDDHSISLEPAVLVISAERIKQALWRRLVVSGPAKGKIHLRLRPARSSYEHATILIDQTVTGWAYQVDVPDAIEPEAFLRAVVHASLLEIANRRADHRTAEVPLWLSEGLCQELLATERLEFLLAPARTKENGLTIRRTITNERRRNPFAEAQAILRNRAPLSFEQLSWPDAGQLSPAGIDIFRSSAHLFVRQLLQFNNGPACLRATLEELARNLNWQLALLSGFRGHFDTQLDIEKWWALQLVQFTGRNLMQVWTPEVSWEKLDAIVRSPAETRSSPLEMPRRTEVTLQIIVREWSGLNQRPALQRKLYELDLLRPYVAQELISLVDEYRSVLRDYLDRQSFSGGFFGLRKQVGPIRNRLADSMVQELNLLDARRLSLRPTPPPITAEVKPALSSETR
jgi:hypothetical protein